MVWESAEVIQASVRPGEKAPQPPNQTDRLMPWAQRRSAAEGNFAPGNGGCGLGEEPADAAARRHATDTDNKKGAEISERPFQYPCSPGCGCAVPPIIKGSSPRMPLPATTFWTIVRWIRIVSEITISRVSLESVGMPAGAGSGSGNRRSGRSGGRGLAADPASSRDRIAAKTRAIVCCNGVGFARPSCPDSSGGNNPLA
jgi:hypothetical protein